MQKEIYSLARNSRDNLFGEWPEDASEFRYDWA